MTELADSLKTIQERIRAACARACRDFSDVTMVAVGKTFEPSVLRAAYDLGVRNFGENRVQEWSEKQTALPGDICWHMIGRLQTNKVKEVIGRITLIHSLDRFELFEKLDSEARSRGIKAVDCLLQVNVSGEPTKAGVAPERAAEFLSCIAPDSPVRVIGLMTMAPLTENREEIRHVFHTTRELFDSLRSGRSSDFCHLSMGMSGDFEIAVEEGATMIRIGSALFGERTARNEEF